LNSETAAALACVALANVQREYPRKLDHLLNSSAGELTPRLVHPAFYGSYDWHSAVHMHWLLARCLRLHPDLEEAQQIGRVLDRHLSNQCIAAELRYFNSTAGRNFERPYGWAWLLELQAELGRLARGWSVAPLANELARRFGGFVQVSPYPIRAGSHGNTAFACVLALDYARSEGKQELETQIKAAAVKWYGADRNAPLAYEPSLDDFLSPALVEAVLMQEVLAPAQFKTWFAEFLPAGFTSSPPTLTDRTDPKQSHLDGLSLSRAWCLYRLGDRDAAEKHLAAALPHVVGGDYVGEHWLASLAALALSAAALRTP
jgi:DUF2891 family protein